VRENRLIIDISDILIGWNRIFQVPIQKSWI